MPKPPLKLPEQDDIEPLDYYVTPGKRKPKPDRRESVFYLPLWSLALMLLIVFAVAGGMIILVIALGGPKNVSGGEPVIIVLTAAPFETPALPEAAPTILPQSAVSTPVASIALSGPTLAPTMTFTPTAITIAVGSEVIVIGAGGVRIRSSPGTDDSVNTVLQVANRGRVFTVVDGPEDADGLKFWKVNDPSSNLLGWAAEGDNAQELLRVFIP